MHTCVQGPGAAGLAVLAPGCARVQEGNLAWSLPSAVRLLTAVHELAVSLSLRAACKARVHIFLTASAGPSIQPGVSSVRMPLCCAMSVGRTTSCRTAHRSTHGNAMCHSTLAPSAGKWAAPCGGMGATTESALGPFCLCTAVAGCAPSSAVVCTLLLSYASCCALCVCRVQLWSGVQVRAPPRGVPGAGPSRALGVRHGR